MRITIRDKERVETAAKRLAADQLSASSMSSASTLIIFQGLQINELMRGLKKANSVIEWQKEAAKPEANLIKELLTQVKSLEKRLGDHVAQTEKAIEAAKAARRGKKAQNTLPV